MTAIRKSWQISIPKMISANFSLRKFLTSGGGTRNSMSRYRHAAYVLILENHILPAFGNRTTISENEVQEFVIASLDDGLAQKAVRDMLIVLKMIVRFGTKLGCDWKTDWTSNSQRYSKSLNWKCSASRATGK